jgi:hypothetical protein
LTEEEIVKAGTLVGVLALLVVTTSTADTKANEELYGTWQLLSWSRHVVGTAESTEPFGKAPHGFLTYGRDGRMLAMIVKANRPKPPDVARMPDQERAELFKTMLAYGGTFEVEGDQVVHSVDISWNENWTGTAQVRNFRIEGSKLTITVAPQIGFDGSEGSAVLTWAKVQ